MTEAEKTPEAMSEADLESVQGAGTAVGNPGEAKGMLTNELASGKKIRAPQPKGMERVFEDE